MARQKGAETPRRIWRLSVTSRALTLAIIVFSFLMIWSCARGGGTAVSNNPEAGVLDATVEAAAPVVDTGPEEAEGPYCGNGKLEKEISEQCDINDLGDATCGSLTNDQQEGTLGCNRDCTFNMIMCYDVPPVAGSEGDPGTGGDYGGA